MKDIIKYIIIIIVVIGIALVVRNLVSSGISTGSSNNGGNSKDKKGSYDVKVSLVDYESKEYIEGAVLVIRNSDNTIIEKWNTTNTFKVIPNLEKGDYSLEQVSANDNYKPAEKISFSISNKDVELVMYNSKKNASEKSDSTTKEDVPVVNTLSNKSIFGIIASIIISFVGISMISYVKRENN